jgi:hypothetical protein
MKTCEDSPCSRCRRRSARISSPCIGWTLGEPSANSLSLILRRLDEIERKLNRMLVTLRSRNVSGKLET